MWRARNRSRRASDKAKTSVSSTSIVPAEGSATPAIRLSSVVFPEPLRPRRTVQLAAGSASCAIRSTSIPLPSPDRNDFLTSRSTTADRGLISTSDVAAGIPPRSAPLEDGERIDRYTDPASKQQRAKGEEELVGLVLGQLVEVQDLDDVGASVPDE